MHGLKRQGAKTHLAEAAERFRSLSAPVFAALAGHYSETATPEERSLLLRLGVAKSAAPVKKKPFELTPREWQVARLVGSGSTNRQTAETLFVSERTVEVHLGNIFGKLGVSSRAQLVRWLFENDELSQTPQ
jgi:DNA-binding NarL/FixJ family response regulator